MTKEAPDSYEQCRAVSIQTAGGPTRLGSKMIDEGGTKKRVRISRKSGEIRSEVSTMARLKEKYVNEVRPKLMKENSYSSVMQVPRLTKITINIGVGEATQNSKTLDAAVGDLQTITGQKPLVTKARKSISNFKLRQGVNIGCAVTLRRDRMYEFLDRLVNIAMPRIRDFRGVSAKSFDGRGNYNLGLREQLIFPEIDYDKIDKVRGMTISITTTAKSMTKRDSCWPSWACRSESRSSWPRSV